MRAGNSLDSDRHQGSDQSRHQGDVYRRIEVITGTVRRRRWTAAEKAQILMESLTPGARVSEVARRHDLNRGLLQTWRRQAMRQSPGQVGTTFVPVRCDDPTAPVSPVSATRSVASAPSDPPGWIEVEIGRARVRVRGAVDFEALRQVLTIIGQIR